MKCIRCHKEIMDSSSFCKFCGTKIISKSQQPKSSFSCNDNVKKIKGIVEEKKKETKAINDNTIIEDKKEKNLDDLIVKIEIRCPYCKSESYHFEKKGFSVGKAVAGVALVGTIGVLGGTVGSNNRVRVCDNCGKEF